MLRKKLFYSFLIFTIIPLLPMVLLGFPQLISVVNNMSHREVVSNVTSVGSAIDVFFFQNIFSRTEYVQPELLKAIDISEGTPEPQITKETKKLETLLKRRSNGVSELEAAIVVDNYDIVRASSLPQLCGRSFSSDYMQQGVVGSQPYVSPVQPASSMKGMPWSSDIVMMGVPLKYNNKVVGRYVGFYNTTYFRRLVKDNSNDRITCAIFDKKGNLVADGSNLLTPALLAGSKGDIIKEQLGEAKNDQEKHESFELTIENQKYDCTFQTARSSGWLVLGIADRKVLYKPIVEIVLTIFVGALLCVAFAYFLGKKLLDNLIGPLEKEFLPAIYRVADGERKAHIAYNRDDEIGMVARALNNLMSDLVERDAQLRASEARYRFILEGNNYIVWEWDANTDSIILSDLFMKSFGFEPDLTRSSQTLEKIKHIHPDDMPIYRKFCKDVFEDAIDATSVFRFKRITGEYTWVRAKSVALYNQSNQCYGAIGAFVDIDVDKKEELRLIEQVRTDALSQTLTRKAFEDVTLKMMRQVDTAQLGGCQLYVCFVDIDDFKNFNTKYGHSFGDRVIRFFGSVLKESVKPYGSVGRVGGDEFSLCFAVGPGDPEKGEIINNIRKKLAEGIQTRDNEENIVITASIGCAAYPQDGANYEELMHCADLDMYASKQALKMENQLRNLGRLEDIGEEEPT